MLQKPGGEWWFEISVRRPLSLVLCIDASMSIAGQKKRFAALALATFLLMFDRDRKAVVTFESQSRLLKAFGDDTSIENLIGRWLDQDFGGTTHMEAGLEDALKLERAVRKTDTRLATVLVTDGKYTTGRNPIYLAKAFRHLIVLTLGDDVFGKDLCRKLSKLGHGEMHSVPEIEALPSALIQVGRNLARGVNSIER